jgi:hypothetical protein
MARWLTIASMLANSESRFPKLTPSLCAVWRAAMGLLASRAFKIVHNNRSQKRRVDRHGTDPPDKQRVGDDLRQRLTYSFDSLSW